MLLQNNGRVQKPWDTSRLGDRDQLARWIQEADETGFGGRRPEIGGTRIQWRGYVSAVGHAVHSLRRQRDGRQLVEHGRRQHDRGARGYRLRLEGRERDRPVEAKSRGPRAAER